MAMRTRPPIAELRRIYEESHTIAVVGASPDPAKRANAIVQAVTHYNDPKILAEISQMAEMIKYFG